MEKEDSPVEEKVGDCKSQSFRNLGWQKMMRARQCKIQCDELNGSHKLVVGVCLHQTSTEEACLYDPVEPGRFL
jgi:hypothetical protein